MIEVCDRAMRNPRRSPALRDTAISVGALTLLVTVLVGLDQRVRDVLAFSGGRPAAGVVDAGWRARDLALVLLETARDQTLDHAPLMIFVLAATVLVLFMLRS